MEQLHLIHIIDCYMVNVTGINIGAIMWTLLFNFISNPKNLLIVILGILVLLISAYSVYLQFSIKTLELKISNLQSANDKLTSDNLIIQSNLLSCNSNLANIKNYTSKVNEISKNTSEISSRIDNLKPTNTTIVQPKETIIVQSGTGDTHEVPINEAVNITNDIINRFNTK